MTEYRKVEVFKRQVSICGYCEMAVGCLGNRKWDLGRADRKKGCYGLVTAKDRISRECDIGRAPFVEGRHRVNCSLR